jgi:hypothetical protein
MTRWACPRCDRQFARAHQAHFCVPGCTLEECMTNPQQREIYLAILTYIKSLGPVHTDIVKVGVFLKHERKLAELRPLARSLDLYLTLPQHVKDTRIARHIRTSAETTVHIVKLRKIEEVDSQLRNWLSQAYDFAQ